MKRKKKHVPLRGSVIGYITEISVAMFLQIQIYIYIYMYIMSGFNVRLVNA